MNAGQSWKMRSLLPLVVVIAFIVHPATLLSGQFRSATSSGLWSATGSWEISIDGGSTWSSAITTPGMTVTDSVIIRNGHALTLDVSPTFPLRILTIGQGASGTLSIGNSTTSRSLSVAGDLTLNSGAALNVPDNGSITHSLTIGGNISSAGAIDLIGGSSVADLTLNGTSPQTLNGTLDVSAFTVSGSSSATMGSNSTLRIYASVTMVGSLDARTNANTIDYAGGNQTIVNPNGGAGGYRTLFLSSSATTSTKTLPGSSLTIAQEFRLTTSGDSLICTAASSLTIGTASDSSGHVFIGSGVRFNGGTNSHTVYGNWTNNGVFSGQSTVSFVGQYRSTIGSTQFYNLIVQKTNNSAAVGGNLAVSGDLSVSSGTMDLATHTANRGSAGGILSVDSQAVLTVGGASGGISGSNFPSGYSTVTLSGTVEYSGSSAQTVRPGTYRHLRFSGAGVKSITSNIHATGNVTIQSSVTVTISSSTTVEIDGDISNAGVMQQAGILIN